MNIMHESRLDEVWKGEIAKARTHVALLCAALPPGPAVAQLQNFCGRGWDLLRTPTFARLYRRMVVAGPRFPELSRIFVEEVYEPAYQMLVRLIEQGMREGAFGRICAHTAARLLMSSFLQQAFWCDHADAFGPSLAGGCNRVVPETLALVLGGLTTR